MCKSATPNTFYLFIHLTQTTYVHTDRFTDQHGQTKLVKQKPEKVIYSKQIVRWLTTTLKVKCRQNLIISRGAASHIFPSNYT